MDHPWWWFNDTPAQVYMAWASIVAAGFSFIAALLLWGTLNVTRRSSKAQIRAYLACVGGEFIILSDDYVEVSVIITNKGQSPARRCTITVRANLPEILGDGDDERITAKPLYTDWQTSNPIPVFLTCDARPYVILTSLPLKQHQRLYNGTDQLRCEVVVEWADVFGETQRETFQLVEEGPWRWNGDVPKSRVGKLEAKNAPEEAA